MAGENISYAVAFAAGFLTFLSPCLLPIIPPFIAYITGVSLGDMALPSKAAAAKRKAVIHSLIFCVGFSVVFILLGLTATFIGRALYQYQKAIQIGGGILVILFGLYLTGALKFAFLGKELKMRVASGPSSYLGSFLLGVTFAAAWTPCAGPILGSILVMAGTRTTTTEGAKLLTAYSLGIALPFVLTAILINTFVAHFNKVKKFMGVVNIIGGVFLIIVGVFLIMKGAV